MANTVKASKATKEQKEQVAKNNIQEITNAEALELLAKHQAMQDMKSDKAPKKDAKKDTAKAAKKVSVLDSISSKIPASVLKGSGSMRNSIYKAELFQDLSDKEKKAARRKLRRNRDSFIATFLECGKDTGKLKALQKQWKEYAEQVYNNISYIFEKNTVEDNQDICQKFITAMAQEYK